jgi:hypothetical protein
MRAIAKENPLLQGIIDRVDLNATTHGQRNIDDDGPSNLIESFSTKRLGTDLDHPLRPYEVEVERQVQRISGF